MGAGNGDLRDTVYAVSLAVCDNALDDRKGKQVGGNDCVGLFGSDGVGRCFLHFGVIYIPFDIIGIIIKPLVA